MLYLFIGQNITTELLEETEYCVENYTKTVESQIAAANNIEGYLLSIIQGTVSSYHMLQYIILIGSFY